MPSKTFFHLKAEKRETVMRAAVGEFVKNGYSRAKISDIAKNAGIAKGSVFQYFCGKRELFTYCAEWGFETFMKKLGMSTRISDMDIFEYMQNNMGKFDLIREESELAAFMNIIMNEPGFDDVLQRLYVVGDVYTKKLVRNGKRKGTVRKDISDDILVEFIYAISDKFKRRWLRIYIADIMTEMKPAQKRAMMKEVRQMQSMLKNGIAAA